MTRHNNIVYCCVLCVVCAVATCVFSSQVRVSCLIPSPMDDCEASPSMLSYS